MRIAAATALLSLVLATPALAASYPVAGKWGQSNSTEKGAIDCARLRVIEFKGERRFDTGGGVPDYRAITVEPQGTGAWRITEEFRTGQVNGRNTITLRQPGADHAELHMQRGGTIKLRRCK
jgi:hypothetical protein